MNITPFLKKIHKLFTKKTLDKFSFSEEDRQWLKLRNSKPNYSDQTENKVVIFVDQNFQRWMAGVLSEMGWLLEEPSMLTEGHTLAYNEKNSAGQPVTTYTTPSATFKSYARKNDPETSKSAGEKIAQQNNSITARSQQGKILLAYYAHYPDKYEIGYTAAEAIKATNIRTEGPTGSSWHRVTDLRDSGMLSNLLDDTYKRVQRKNQDSNSMADVMVLTPMGFRAARKLLDLLNSGYENQPLVFDGPTDNQLFEIESAKMADMSETMFQKRELNNDES